MAVCAPSRPSRRAFLRGSTSQPARPPYALAEAAFLDACTRCDACIDACPEAVLRRGDGGYPELDFPAGECSFCARCLDVCPSAALDHTAHRAWVWRAQVDDACLTSHGIVCRSCADACGRQAIGFERRPGAAAPRIDSDNCSGCGACVGVCPASAMSMQELPA
jgi:ferredoxin-type protein NapF